MSLSEEYIENILSEVAANLELSSWHHSIRNFDSIGQNYFGIIMPVSLTGSKSNSETHINIVLKLAPTDERYRVSGAVTLMFKREIFVYSVLMKKYKEFLVENVINPIFIMPSLYLARDEYCKEVIVMEDMCDSGYQPFTHKQFLDLEHVTVALKSLAQFHALSFILKERDGKLYDEVTKTCIPLTEDSNKRYMDIMRDRLTKALCKFENTQYVPLLQYLKFNCGPLFDKAIELAANTCICHGDVWKENILFQYENFDENKKPIQACLIDYQTARVSSPAFDTLYLIISSTDTLLRRECYFSMLDTYFDTFKTFLNSYQDSIQIKECYSRNDFNNDLKIVAPSCLITANTALWLSNGLQEEGHVRSKQTWTTSEEKTQAVNHYKSIVQAIVDDFHSYGYLEHLEYSGEKNADSESL